MQTNDDSQCIETAADGAAADPIESTREYIYITKVKVSSKRTTSIQLVMGQLNNMEDS